MEPLGGYATLSAVVTFYYDAARGRLRILEIDLEKQQRIFNAMACACCLVGNNEVKDKKTLSRPSLSQWIEPTATANRREETATLEAEG